MKKMQLALLTGGLLLAAFIPTIARGALGEDNPYPEPPESVVTVPPRDAGDDYKSNPAEPEPEPAKDSEPLSREEKEAIYESIDPHDSPDIRVCVNSDGSGSAQFFAQAEPDAPEVQPPPGEEEVEVPKIKDKESCQ